VLEKIINIPWWLVSKHVYNVRDFVCKIRHDQVWQIKQIWIMTKEGKWYVSTTGDGEGVIRKTTGRHERYKLTWIGSRGCSNYQALSKWWRDVFCHGWRITSDNLGKNKKISICLGHCWRNFILSISCLVLKYQRVQIWINISMCSITSLAI